MADRPSSKRNSVSEGGNGKPRKSSTPGTPQNLLVKENDQTKLSEERRKSQFENDQAKVTEENTGANGKPRKSTVLQPPGTPQSSLAVKDDNQGNEERRKSQVENDHAKPGGNGKLRKTLLHQPLGTPQNSLLKENDQIELTEQRRISRVENDQAKVTVEKRKSQVVTRPHSSRSIVPAEVEVSDQMLVEENVEQAEGPSDVEAAPEKVEKNLQQQEDIEENVQVEKDAEDDIQPQHVEELVEIDDPEKDAVEYDQQVIEVPDELQVDMEEATEEDDQEKDVEVEQEVETTNDSFNERLQDEESDVDDEQEIKEPEKVEYTGEEQKLEQHLDEVSSDEKEDYEKLQQVDETEFGGTMQQDMDKLEHVQENKDVEAAAVERASFLEREAEDDLEEGIEENVPAIGVSILYNQSDGRVLFLEARKDFVDLLMNFLLLPLGSVMKLLHDYQSNVNGLGAVVQLFQSFDKMEQSSMLVDKEILTLSPHDLWKKHSTQSGAEKGNILELLLRHPQAGRSKEYQQIQPHAETGYVKDNLTFTITDELDVFPSSTIKSIALFNALHVKNMADLKSIETTVDTQDLLRILMASMTSKSVLNDVFKCRL